MKKWMFVLIASTGFAALPPLAQSIREMEALLADPRLYDALGSGEMIQEVVRNKRGYLVVTQHYTLQVDLEYQREHRIGPARFDLKFQEPVESR